jgi:sugar-specific transcriptional regulator TrmB
VTSEQRLDLTPFGFTPTESLVYEVLLTGGPGTGYAIARSAGLARANAYGALEGLVAKGAARMEGERPRRYRPEPPQVLLARIASDQGQALDRLRARLDQIAVPDTPTLVEIATPRAALQLIGYEAARARESVRLAAPAEAYPLLAPSLRRPASAGVPVTLLSADGEARLDFAPVRPIAARAWPGTPLLAVIDDRSAVVAARNGAAVRGHWSSAPAFVAAARLAFEQLADSE